MKNLIVLTAVFCGLTLGAYAQDFGFLGKKNRISIFTTSSIRAVALVDEFIEMDILNGQSSYNEYGSNNLLNEKFKLFRTDVRASYSRLINPRVSVGVEFGYEKHVALYSVYLSSYNSSGSGFSGNGDFSPSRPKFNVYQYMLTIELAHDGALAPIGFSSMFGVGGKTYAFRRNENYRFNSENAMEYVFPDYKTNMKSVNFFYQLVSRYPITKWLSADVGVRANIGIGLFGRSPEKNSENTSGLEPVWTKSDLSTDVFVSNISNIFSFRFGFSFIL